MSKVSKVQKYLPSFLFWWSLS